MEVHVPVMRVLSMRGWSWDNCEADEADVRLVDKLRFPADQSFWNSLDRATWECAYAKEPPLSTVQSSLTPDVPLTINQYLLVSFVRAFERVNPLVVSIISGEAHCEQSDATGRGGGSSRSRRPHKFRASADFWRAFLLYGSRTGRVYTQRTSFLQLEVSCRVSDTLPKQDSSNAVHYARSTPAEESVAAMAAAAEATGVRYVNAYEWSKFCGEWERSIGVCWDGEAHAGAESYDPYQDPDNWWYDEDGEAYYAGASAGADPSVPPQRYRWDYEKDAWALEKPPPELVPPSSVLFSPDDVWVSVGRKDTARSGGGGSGGEKDGGPAAGTVVVHVTKGSKAGGGAAEEGADAAAAESAEDIVLLRRRLREQEDELAARGKQMRRLAGDVASLKLQQQQPQLHQRQQQQPTTRRVEESSPAPTQPPPPPPASPGSSFLGAASERQDTLIREIEDGLHDWASSLHRTRHRRPEPQKAPPGAGTAAAVLLSLQQPSSAGLQQLRQWQEQQSYATASPMKSAVDAPVWGTAPTRR